MLGSMSLNISQKGNYRAFLGVNAKCGYNIKNSSNSYQFFLYGVIFMISDNRWYLTAIIGIITLIVGQGVSLYFDILNSPSDFNIYVHPIKDNTTRSTERFTAEVHVTDCHPRLNPYEYQILLYPEDVPDDITVVFDPDVINPKSNILCADRDACSEMSVSVLPQHKGDYRFTIHALGGDGTKRSCYYTFTKKEVTYYTDTEPVSKLQSTQSIPKGRPEGRLQ